MFGFNIDVGGILSSVFQGLLIVAGMVAFAAIGFYVMWIKQFKHYIRIKDVVKGRMIISDDKFREYTDSDGVSWCHIFKARDRIPLPPSEAVELNASGKKVVECYRLGPGEYIFAKDIAEPIPTEILDMDEGKTKREKIKAHLNKFKDKAIAAYQPLTTKQRVIMIEQIKKAHMKKTKKWQDMIMPVAGIAAVTIIIVAMMIFYADMAKPLLDMADKQKSYASVQLETMKVIRDMKYDIQTIKEEVTDNKGGAPN